MYLQIHLLHFYFNCQNSNSRTVYYILIIPFFKKKIMFLRSRGKFSLHWLVHSAHAYSGSRPRANTRSQEFHPELVHEWQAPRRFTRQSCFQACEFAGSWKRELGLSVGPRASYLQREHFNGLELIHSHKQR